MVLFFSEWLKENNIELNDCFNILKLNIEGAEWHLMNDIIDNDLNQYFSLFLGSCDIHKIGEMMDKDEEFSLLLEQNNINLVYPPENFGDLVEVIDNKLWESEQSGL